MTADQEPAAEHHEPAGTSRRELGTAVALVALGAAVALLGSDRSSGTTPGVPAAPGADTGAGAPAALALVALAGAGAVLLVRNRTRTVLGVALVALAVGLVVVGLTPTRWTALVAALLVGLGGALVVARARRWPQPRGRHDAPRTTGGGTPHDAWDALDRGDDPTA